ncbi:MAG TPA: S41 family peptidase [Gemmatimonadaceae bacterium]
MLSSALVTGGWLMERGARSPARDFASRVHLFNEVLQHIRRDYVDALPDSTLYRHAIDGALRELHDPHTVFLDPRRLTRLDESTNGHYAGVGIQMDVRDNGVTVIATLPGSPAEQAGLTTGDRIVAIEGNPTHGLTANEALKTLRGAVGTSVHVLVERPGITERMSFTLVRRTIEVNPVQHALIVRDGVGYVNLTIFSAAAAADLTHAIDSLRGAGARSLVLDLRGDPGGLLRQGIDVADLFLDTNQPIVATRGRSAEETHAFADQSPQRWADMPMVVLTDSSSASASEIVAGALQDHDRALIVGTATYGKGSAQRVFRVDNGGLKVTTALWYTPSGRSINRPRVPVTDDSQNTPPRSDSATPRPKFKTDAGRTVLGGGGIVPDVEVANRVVTAADKTFQRALGAKLPRFRDAIVEYALSLKASHAVSDPNFTITPPMRDELYRRMQARGVAVSRAVYDSAGPLVSRALSSQLSRYVFGPQAEFARGLHEDPAMTRAIALLHGVRTPKELLGRVPPSTR